MEESVTRGKGGPASSALTRLRRASSTRGSRASGSMSDDDADAQRLGSVALLIAAVILAVWALVATGLFAGAPAPRLGPPPPPPLYVFPALVLISLLVFGCTRLRALRGRTLAWLGVVYQLLGASVLAYKVAWTISPVPPGYFSWLAVWILLFPLVAPRRPIEDLFLAAACASFPLAAALHGVWWRGEVLPSAKALFFLGHPYFVCALLATGPSYVISRLQDDVATAEERWRRLGSYRLIRKLAAGGMGEVWYAEHELLVRPAAVKLVRPDKLALQEGEEQRETRARFELEAQETALLTSAHTVRVYDFGATDEGSLFLAMELLEGTDLERFVDEHGPLAPSRAVSFLRQACASLSEAHEHGLIHRDVKPANLFVTRDGLREDFLKVLDFGLIALRNRSFSSAIMENGDFVVGTPACMAPEQVTGREIDGRADVYALGCVAYFMLTGLLPFQRDTVIALLTAHAYEAPLPLDELAPKTPPCLANLVHCCLAKDPEDRPQSARELADALAALPLPPWTERDAEDWWGTRREAEALGDTPDPLRASTRRLPARQEARRAG